MRKVAFSAKSELQKVKCGAFVRTGVKRGDLALPAGAVVEDGAFQ